ncbi:TPA: DUF2971 domain-containing protein [Stenotrophomonas maltophilia]|nr:DUF2971 domain-containing protein [Stenotrophomonas maltophilia]HDS1042740.1 DUF2971 domain-containing protein [Stenotrophomonas maltophilia]
MNDSREIQWGMEVLQEVQESRSDIPDVLQYTLAVALAEFGEKGVSLASCLSTDGDVLSQWRAYADNGEGFAIGLDPWALDDLPVTFLAVCYDRAEQIASINAFLDGLIEQFNRIPSREEFEEGIHQGGNLEAEASVVEAQFNALQKLSTFGVTDLVAFKNKAFSEEKEVRIVQIAYADGGPGSAVRLINNDDEADWPDERRPSVKFRMRAGVPLCFMDLPIPLAAITEIVIGPRNTSTDAEIHRLLNTLGYPDVKVRRSKASYR